MLIDWFTVGAQAVNFLILVWLLKHFLYQPILHAIDAREKRIAAERADADEKRSEARKERDEFQQKNRSFDAERGALFSKAADEANAERSRRFEEVRVEAASRRDQQEETLRDERKRLGNEIAQLAQREVFGIARKALADLATVSLEERFGEVFTRRLRQMDAPAKEALGTAMRTSAGAAIARSTFELPDEQKAAIQNALNETFAMEVRLRFEIDSNAICGIELTAGGQKLEWNIAGYLAAMEHNVSALLDSAGAP
jgi:F-type H+-transporting ATPase subunit b